MNAFTKRLLLLLGGIAGCIVCATALTGVVEYKPWGVHDSDREEYDRRLANMVERAELEEFYASKFNRRPIAQSSAPSFEAGLIQPDEEQTHAFTIRNGGDEPLKLESISADGIDAALASSMIAPGETTELIVNWTSPAADEAFDHRIKVRTNDPLNETLKFHVHGSTRKELVVPDSASFGPTDPATRTEGSFLVYSQLWPSFEIEDVSSDLNLFEWHAEPVEASDEELEETNAVSAWRVRMWTTKMEFGHYDGTVQIKIKNKDGETSQQTVSVAGRVRPPIIFHSPDIHMIDGLDLGTVFAGKEYNHHVLVRLRGDLDRKIEVLDIQPPELKATLEPQDKRGNYRLTVTIPEDCPMVVFNIAEKHGYVEVGDPDDRQFKNWFPLHGAVVPKKKP